jgi:hypothetical protein
MTLFKAKPDMDEVTKPEDKSAEQHTREQIGVFVHLAIRHLQGTTDHLKMLVWDNPYGLTPAQVLAVLDDDGEELDVLLKGLITAHNEVAPKVEEKPDWVPEDKTVSEKDGVLTVTNKIEVAK